MKTQKGNWWLKRMKIQQTHPDAQTDWECSSSLVCVCPIRAETERGLSRKHIIEGKTCKYTEKWWTTTLTLISSFSRCFTESVSLTQPCPVNTTHHHITSHHCNCSVQFGLKLDFQPFIHYFYFISTVYSSFIHAIYFNHVSITFSCLFLLFIHYYYYYYYFFLRRLTYSFSELFQLSYALICLFYHFSIRPSLKSIHCFSYSI